MAITFEQLQKANEATKSTDIGKKDYVEVNQRIKAFRMLFPNGLIDTEIASLENGVCIFRAKVFDEEGKLLGTGTAYEKENSTFINKTSYIENCETSAVGRALAMLGIGIEASVASKEEVENAKLNQKEQPKVDTVAEAKARARVLGYFNRHNMTQEDIAKLCKCYKINAITEMTLEQCNHYIAQVEKNGGSIDE